METTKKLELYAFQLRKKKFTEEVKQKRKRYESEQKAVGDLNHMLFNPNSTLVRTKYKLIGRES